jgi:hypothetical protein
MKEIIGDFLNVENVSNGTMLRLKGIRQCIDDKEIACTEPFSDLATFCSLPRI